jgi:type III secretory pathway component EscV
MLLDYIPDFRWLVFAALAWLWIRFGLIIRNESLARLNMNEANPTKDEHEMHVAIVNQTLVLSCMSAVAIAYLVSILYKGFPNLVTAYLIACVVVHLGISVSKQAADFSRNHEDE